MENIIEPIQKTSPKDVFLHLLAIVTLYASAVSLGVLLFDYINLAFPDPLVDGAGYYDYAVQAYHDSIRWSVSALVVVFPVFLFTTRFLNKSYDANPTKRNLRIRKWLVYFTLFATAVVVIGDLVALIYNFLGGEITIRFFLEVLTIALIAGSIFFYYFHDVRKYKTE